MAQLLEAAKAMRVGKMQLQDRHQGDRLRLQANQHPAPSTPRLPQQLKVPQQLKDLRPCSAESEACKGKFPKKNIS